MPLSVLTISKAWLSRSISLRISPRAMPASRKRRMCRRVSLSSAATAAARARKFLAAWRTRASLVKTSKARTFSGSRAAIGNHCRPASRKAAKPPSGSIANRPIARRFVMIACAARIKRFSLLPNRCAANPRLYPAATPTSPSVVATVPRSAMSRIVASRIRCSERARRSPCVRRGRFRASPDLEFDLRRGLIGRLRSPFSPVSQPAATCKNSDRCRSHPSASGPREQCIRVLSVDRTRHVSCVWHTLTYYAISISTTRTPWRCVNRKEGAR